MFWKFPIFKVYVPYFLNQKGLGPLREIEKKSPWGCRQQTHETDPVKDGIFSIVNIIFQISLSKEDSLSVMYRWVELLWSSNEKVILKYCLKKELEMSR